MKEKTIPKTSIIGALTKGLRPEAKVFCITIESLMTLVTKDEGSNESMLEKEKLWMDLNWASLMCLPKEAAALAAYLEYKRPLIKDIKAQTPMTVPQIYM